MPWRRIEARPKTGPKPAFPRALAHHQAMGGGGVPDAPKQSPQKPFLARRRPGRACIAARAIRPGPRSARETRSRRLYCAGTGREARSTTHAPAGVSGAFSGPARGILRREATQPSVATMPPASGYRPHAAQAEDLATMPPAGRPRKAGLHTQVCAAHSAAKRFHARMFRTKSHVEGEQ